MCKKIYKWDKENFRINILTRCKKKKGFHFNLDNTINIALCM